MSRRWESGEPVGSGVSCHWRMDFSMTFVSRVLLLYDPGVLTSLLPQFESPPSHMRAKSLQSCPTLCDPTDCSPPLSVGFSRQEYWSELPCPPPGDLPNPGIEPMTLTSPALAAGFFTTSATFGSPFSPHQGPKLRQTCSPTCFHNHAQHSAGRHRCPGQRPGCHAAVEEP